jgi:hypothetical protein
LRGVRISCDMVARNCDFASFAACFKVEGKVLGCREYGSVLPGFVVA